MMKLHYQHPKGFPEIKRRRLKHRAKHLQPNPMRLSQIVTAKTKLIGPLCRRSRIGSQTYHIRELSLGQVVSALAPSAEGGR